MSAPISVRSVSRRFGRALALDTVDLEVAAGEFVALVGPSGCGKTTLLRIVADLETPTTGAVLIGGTPPAQARQSRLLGFVSQRPAVLPWKRAVDDVAFTQRITRRRSCCATSAWPGTNTSGRASSRAAWSSG
jgi:NitT/TauT family transport system ATP-binding protein